MLHKELEIVDLDLKTQQAQYSRLLNSDTAIYKLPNELLAEIFMLCADNRSWPIPSRNGSNFHLFQVVVSHVSRRWREVALGAPLLWNVINLKVTGPVNHRQGRILSQLEAHCERSATCFLDIKVEFYLGTDMASFCKLLGRYSERWRRLSVLTRFQEMDDIQSMLVDAKAPTLEHLSLSLGKGTISIRQKSTSVIPTILSCCPRLSFLRLAGKALGSLHPPTSSVATLHLDDWIRGCIKEDLFKSILEGAPLLVNLSLNEVDLRHLRDPSIITQPTTLLHLRSLRICDPFTPLSRLMSLIDMPQLQSLTLNGVESFDCHVLKSVESLILDDCPFSEEDLGKLICCLPSLSELSIDESVPAIFYMLSPEITDIPNPTETEVAKRRLSPWPRLQTIIIRELQPIDVPHFFNMVVGRQSMGSKSGLSPLKKILLDRRSRTVLRAKQKLEWLQERVIVENDIPAKWPLDLGYEDAHDLLE